MYLWENSLNPSFVYIQQCIQCIRLIKSLWSGYSKPLFILYITKDKCSNSICKYLHGLSDTELRVTEKVKGRKHLNTWNSKSSLACLPNVSQKHHVISNLRAFAPAVPSSWTIFSQITPELSSNATSTEKSSLITQLKQPPATMHFH